MKLLLLEVVKDGEVLCRSLHPTKDEVFHELYKFVNIRWDQEVLHNSRFRDYDVDDGIKLFFDGMPGYSHEIVEMHVDLPEAPAVNDVHRGMDEVVIDAVELALLRFCLGNVQYKNILTHLRQSTGSDVSLPQAQNMVHSLIGKLE